MTTEVNEKMKACRESYWSEVDDKEKIKRLRVAVKHLQTNVAMLMKFMRYLQAHSHTQDGSLVIPMFMKDEPQINDCGYLLKGKDDVYF